MKHSKSLVLALLVLFLCLAGTAALAEPAAVEASSPIAVGKTWSFTVEGSFANATSPTEVDTTAKPLAYRLFQYEDGTKNLSTSIEISYTFNSYNCIRSTQGTYYGNYSMNFTLKPLKGTPAGDYVGEIFFEAPQATVCTVSFTVKPYASGLLHDSNLGVDYLVSANGKNLSLKALTGSRKSLIIPAYVTVGTVKYPVTKIEANALKGNTTLTTLAIGKNVTTVGNYAFKNCTALKKVTGGTGITVLNRGAFAGCKKLTSVNLGAKLTTIGVQAFYKCTTLPKVVIPANVTKISLQAFYGCSKLKAVNIKTKKLVTGSIGKNAFGATPNPTFTVPAGKLTLYTKLLKDSGINITSTTILN